MDCMKLRGEIVAKHKTQAAFAEAIGWHKNKVSKMLTGQYLPDADEAAKIAEMLDMSDDMFCSIFLPKKSRNGDIFGEVQSTRDSA